MSWIRTAKAARRALIPSLGRRHMARSSMAFFALTLWTIGFVVRTLHAVDLAPVMYSHDQPGTRMAARYDEAARAHLDGGTWLYPQPWPEPSDTGLLARPPGYALFIAGVYGLVGDSYFAVQLAQGALCALLPVVLMLLVSGLWGRTLGLLAGALASLDAPLAYYSNVVTPDALGTLLAVAVVALLWGRRGRWHIGVVAAGLVLGAATWLRPNFLLLGPFLALGWVWAATRRKATLPWALALASGAALVVAPITVRNLRIYHAFVPVSINSGIVLWEGIADAGGERFGARGIDWQVAAEEAQLYGDERYGHWWASPDGIWRDRERVRRSLAVIEAEPVWFCWAALRRAALILNYGDGGVPLVTLHGEPLSGTNGGHGLDASARTLFAAGRLASALRPAVRLLQWSLAWATLPLALCGVGALALLSPRRLLLLALVPLYHLLTQAPLHYEPRFVLPMHPFMLVLAAAGVLALVAAARDVFLRRAQAPA